MIFYIDFGEMEYFEVTFQRWYEVMSEIDLKRKRKEIEKEFWVKIREIVRDKISEMGILDFSNGIIDTTNKQTNKPFHTISKIDQFAFYAITVLVFFMFLFFK